MTDLPTRIAAQSAHLAFHHMAAERCRQLGMLANARLNDQRAAVIADEMACDRQARTGDAVVQEPSGRVRMGDAAYREMVRDRLRRWYAKRTTR